MTKAMGKTPKVNDINTDLSFTGQKIYITNGRVYSLSYSQKLINFVKDVVVILA